MRLTFKKSFFLSACGFLLLTACQQQVTHSIDNNADSSFANSSSSSSLSSPSEERFVEYNANGIRFKYVATYTVSETKGSYGVAIHLQNKDKPTIKADDPEPSPSDFKDITISIADNSENLSLQEIAEKEGNINDIQFMSDKIAGEQAAHYLFPSLISTQITAILHDGKVFSFETYENNGSQKDLQDILNSLEFTQ